VKMTCLENFQNIFYQKLNAVFTIEDEEDSLIRWIIFD